MNTEIENKLTLSAFEDSLGDCFELRLEHTDPLPLELVEVKHLKSSEQSPTKEPFSLLFRGPKNTYFPQQLYDLEHHQLGKLTLFLVPMMPDERGSYFESIFN